MNSFYHAGYAVAVVTDTTVSFSNEMVVIEMTVEVIIMVNWQRFHMINSCQFCRSSHPVLKLEW